MAFVAACGPGEAQREQPNAVLIGIDSADWRIIDDMIARGRMPNLARLRDLGTSGPIRTLTDIPLSPVVWTSIATGRTAADHGITWFMVDQKDGTRVPVRSHNRRTRAIWNILAEQGLRPVSIGWWATYPAEAVDPGVIVSDALGFHGFGRTARRGADAGKVHPPERFAEFDALVPPVQQVPIEFAARFMRMDPDDYGRARFDPALQKDPDVSNPVHLFQESAVTAQGYTAIAEQLLDEPYDLLMVYYEQTDSLSHIFMKYAPPRLEWISEEDHARFKDVVAEWYAYQDELLGRLLAKIDLERTAVFVVSDHGFKSGDRRIRSEQAIQLETAHLDHEVDGIFLAAGPGIRRGARIEDASVMDVTPTLLHSLGLPVAKDMAGKVLTSIFEPVDGEDRPIRYVGSYEVTPTKPTGPVPADAYGAAELAENLAGLEALGYIASESTPGPGPDESDDEASSPEIHNNLARIHLAAGETDEAATEFDRALALDPQNIDALLGLASVASARGNLVQAEHLAKLALATNPDSPTAMATLASVRVEAGDLDEAIRLYREAVDLEPSSPPLLIGLGDGLQRAGKYPEAEEIFERALALDPDSIVARYNLGVTAFQQGREEEAIAHYEAALALDPRGPMAASILNNLGTVHFDREELEPAMQAWERAAAASPAQYESRVNLAIQYMESGRIDDSIPLLEQAAALSPNSEIVHARLARAYMEKGRGEEAYRSLMLVYRLYPENWFGPLGLAVLYAATDRPVEARGYLDEALRLGGDVARERASGYGALDALLDVAPGDEEPAPAER